MSESHYEDTLPTPAITIMTIDDPSLDNAESTLAAVGRYRSKSLPKKAIIDVSNNINASFPRSDLLMMLYHHPEETHS